MEHKKDNTVDNVCFWAWGEGMEESEEFSPDKMIFEKDNLKIAFVAEFDKSELELRSNIASMVQNKIDYIYVVTNDNGKRQELLKVIPDYCGILCYGDIFGLGFLYMVLKEPKQIKR